MLQVRELAASEGTEGTVASFSHFRLVLGHKQSKSNGGQNYLHCLHACFFFERRAELILLILRKSVVCKLQADCT